MDDRNLPPLALSPRRLRHTLATMFAATGVCLALWLVRFAISHHTRFSGLFGNLLLAWIPVVLSLALLRWWRQAIARWLLAACWLVFFPNAFYLVTDLIHIKKFGLDGLPRWYDQMMTSTYAIAGVFLASFSLYVLQDHLRRRHGTRVGWIFALTSLALSAVGIYLGRILRLNSWDLAVRPDKLVAAAKILAEPGRLGELAAFSSVLFAFSLVAYAFVASLTQLHRED